MSVGQQFYYFLSHFLSHLMFFLLANWSVTTYGDRLRYFAGKHLSSNEGICRPTVFMVPQTPLSALRGRQRGEAVEWGMGNGIKEEML